MMAKACPDEFRLLQFLRNELPEEDSRWIDEHITACMRCDQLLERINGSPAGMLGLSIEMLVPSPEKGDFQPPEIAGYQILELAGSGGMGLVYRALHEKLGRILALKVLRPGLADSAECRERFEHEARLNARLQHPGIVPVHEKGLTADGRPFFSMRLVGGHTLEERLNSSQGSGQNTQELLRIFQTVCEGVAYAHSHRVIHRDLKPANIMIGDFGEVQVMDWGLAKDLSEINAEPPLFGPVEEATWKAPNWQTQRALGTYAYMPPEQAQARTDLQDERSDVFSLGAILCHILTGEPPYVEIEGQPLRSQAEGVLLERTLLRLDRSNAHPDLVSLVKQCLALRKEDRPVSAGDVARRIRSHQTALEAQHRQQQVLSATAEVEQRESRKRRALRWALLGTGLLLVLFALAVAWRQHRLQKLRQQEVVERQEGSIQRVESALSRNDWGTAKVTLEDSELQRVSEPLAPRALQARRDLELAMRLDELDEQRQVLLANPTTAKDYFRELERTFQKYGFDVDSEDEERVGGLLRRSQINTAIVESLDRWCEQLTDGKTRERLARLASLADHHPTSWKADARNASTWRNRDKLKVVTAETPWDEAPPSLVVLLAWQLRLHGEDALGYLQRAQIRFPNDFWVNTLLAQWIAGPSSGWKNGQGKPEIAIEYLRAARAARPRSAIAHTNLAVALTGRKRYDEALTLLQESIRLLPDSHLVHFNLGWTLLESGQPDKSLDELRKAIQLNPRHSNSHYQLGVALERLKRFEEAEAAFRESIKIEPRHADAWLGLGNSALFKNDWRAAITAYQESMRLDPSSLPTLVNLSIAQRNSGAFVEAVESARNAVALSPNRRTFMLLSDVLRAKGDLQEAQQWRQRAMQAP